MLYSLARKFLNLDETRKNKIVDYYNSYCLPLVNPRLKYTLRYEDNWCAAFITVLANMKGIKPPDFPYGVSVNEQLKESKSLGYFSTGITLTRPDDIVFYDWNGNGFGNHVGIVTANDGEVITVIEGNISKTVGYRTVKIPNDQVIGYARYPYQIDDIPRLAREVLGGRMGRGASRMRILGDLYRDVQREVNDILREDRSKEKAPH